MGKDKISNQVNKFKKYFKKKIKIIDVDLNEYYKKLKLSLKVFSSPVASHDFPEKLILSEEAKKMDVKLYLVVTGLTNYLEVIKLMLIP